MASERYTVLIVDDDEEIVDLLREYFRERNFEVISTTDSLKVVETLHAFSTKLLVLDLKMRDLDGFGVLEKIKGAGLPLPPTIIITGYFPKYKDRLERHGINENDVVKKPFSFDALEEAISRKLGKQISADEPEREHEDELYKKNRCVIGCIEDEEDVLEYFPRFFEERNYQVLCYRNGTEAFEALQKRRVDILFVDIKLPGMQGDRIIERLSQQPNPPYMIPISADLFPGDMKARLAAAGCRDFISKPFDVIELIALVKTVALERKLLG